MRNRFGSGACSIIPLMSVHWWFFVRRKPLPSREQTRVDRNPVNTRTLLLHSAAPTLFCTCPIASCFLLSLFKFALRPFVFLLRRCGWLVRWAKRPRRLWRLTQTRNAWRRSPSRRTSGLYSSCLTSRYQTVDVVTVLHQSHEQKQ